MSEMYKAQRLIKLLMEAIRARASMRMDWNATKLAEIYVELYGDEPLKFGLDREKQKTWEWMFPFKGHARNFLVIDPSPRVKLSGYHVEKVLELVIKLGFLPADEETPSETVALLEYLLEKVNPNEPSSVPVPFTSSQEKPAVHNLLHDARTIFVGRDNVMSKIRSTFEQSSAAKTIVAVHGIGGAGKTSIAEEFGRRYENEYAFILFIGADTADILRANVVKVVRSKKFKIAPDEADYEEAAAALGDWLLRNPRSLLILDNVDHQNTAAAVKSFLAHMRAGHILITTRIPNWDHGVTTILLGALKADDAEHFLQSATEGRRYKEDTDIEDAKRLAKRLGYIPSLLTYAGAYIKHNPISFAEYEERWLKKRKELSWLDEEKSRRLTGYPTAEQAATWLTSYDQLREEKSRHLIECLAWFGAEEIPYAIVPRHSDLSKALNELEDYSLITPANSDATGKRYFTINSALQDVARTKQEAEQETQPLIDAANLVASAFNRDRSGFVPHAMKILHHLHDERYIASDAADHLDPLGRLAVLSLASITDVGADAIPYLVTLFSDFYEIEPLGRILEQLASNDEKWTLVHGPLLEANNYVLRYAMAEAIAKKWSVPKIVNLLRNPKTLNEFELAGYALALKYAGEKDASKIDPKLLTILAEWPVYSGRSILGDFFLNVVFRKDRKGTPLEKLDGLAGPKFWTPIWDFIQLDVDAIRAAEALMAGRDTVKGDEASATLKNLKELVGECAKFKNIPRFKRSLQALREGYFSLGEDPNRIRSAYTELAGLDDRDDLCAWMRLLFAHPIWSVAESAATVLSSLAIDDEDRREERIAIIRELLDHKSNWRVEFGACEAAFAVRDIKEDLFYASVEKHFAHWNCKIRGLCAENLLAHMLNSSTRKRNALYKRFKVQIRRWVRDDDCWVLEHVHRFFHTLGGRGIRLVETVGKKSVQVKPSALASGGPILGKVTGWDTLERDSFLEKIEAVRHELVGRRKR